MKRTKSKKVWQRSNDNLFLRDITGTTTSLESKVYSLMRDDGSGELYLQEKFSKFPFDFKVYGLEKKFIERVRRTFLATKGNMGILLNGVKGTGDDRRPK